MLMFVGTINQGGIIDGYKSYVTDGNIVFSATITIYVDLTDVDSDGTIGSGTITVSASASDWPDYDPDTTVPVSVSGTASGSAGAFVEDPDLYPDILIYSDWYTIGNSSWHFTGRLDSSKTTVYGMLSFAVQPPGDVYSYRLDFLGTLSVSDNDRPIVASIMNNGESSRRVDILFVAEGYTESEQSKFIADATRANDYFFPNSRSSSADPFMTYKSFFNSSALFVPSLESGFSTESTRVITAFGAMAHGADERLIYGDEVAVKNVVGTVYDEDEPEIIIVLINSDRYGGAGGSIAWATSDNARSLDVAMHEIGHSFAGLQDEYIDEAIAAQHPLSVLSNSVHVSTSSDPNAVPWRDWIGYRDELGVVGTYEGGYYRPTGVWRATEDSKMRSLSAPFSAPEREEFINRFYREVGDYTTLTQPLLTKLKASTPDNGLFNFKWSINGVSIDNASAEIDLLDWLNTRPDGLTLLNVSLDVTDATGFLRRAAVIENASDHLTKVISLAKKTIDQGQRDYAAAQSGNHLILGDDLDNIIRAKGESGSSSYLKGSGGNDQIYGDAGDDVLVGGAGYNVLDGGNGHDTALFGNSRASYSIAQSAGGVTISGVEGVDQVIAVETLLFANSSIDIADLVIVDISSQTLSSAEGNLGSTVYGFLLTLSKASSESQFVKWTVSGNGLNPADPADFVGGNFPSRVETFAPNETSRAFTIEVSGDAMSEADESFIVSLSSESAGLVLGMATAGGVIRDDDTSPARVVSIAALPVVKAEGNIGTTSFTFVVSLDQAAAVSQTVTWKVTGAGAHAADAVDFGGALPSSTVSFAPGDVSKTIAVSVQGDTAIEFDEGFTVMLSNPTGGATLGMSTGSGLILTDDGSPRIVSIAALSAVKAEGNIGATSFTFVASLDQAAAVGQTVTWSVTGSGEHAADGLDFGGILPSNTVSFTPGDTSKTITVSVQGDASVEFDEGFTVTLSNPTGGTTLGTSTASATIQNDDAPPSRVVSLTALSALKAEGNIATTSFTFVVSLDQAAAVSQTVTWSVTGSGAHAADAVDFGGALPSSTVSFAPGDVSKTITVSVLGDTAVEFDEGFTVTLSNPTEGATLGTSTASGLILTDDGSPRTVSLAALSAVKAEGNTDATSFTFVVSLDQAAAVSQTVTWSVAGSGEHAADAVDFGGILPSDTVSFGPGDVSKTITVNVQGDTAVELDEGFTVALSNPTSGATLGTSTAIGRIQNDDTLAIVNARDDAHVVMQGTLLAVDAAAGVLLNDDNAATASLVVGPAHGTLSLGSNGAFNYTPAMAFAGIDRFLYRVSNGTSSDEAEALVYVVPTQGTTTRTLSLLALTAEEQIAATYVAFFGRAPDFGGFDFWVGQFSSGLPVQGPGALFANIASSFGVSPEAKALYPFLGNPFGASDAQISAFLASVYNNLFNRSPDSGGLAYWTGQIKQTLLAGQFVGSVLVNIMSGAQDTAAGKDITTLMGRLAVGLDYVHDQQEHGMRWNGASDVAAATNLLHAVSADPQSVLLGIRTAELLVANHA